MQIMYDIAQHHVNNSEFNIVMMDLMNHFSGNMRPFGYHFCVSFETQAQLIIDYKHVMQQWTCQVTAFRMLRTYGSIICFFFEYQMHITLYNVATVIYLEWQWLSYRWLQPQTQISQPWMTWVSGTRWPKGSYRMTLLRVSSDILPS